MAEGYFMGFMSHSHVNDKILMLACLVVLLLLA